MGSRSIFFGPKERGGFISRTTTQICVVNHGYSLALPFLMWVSTLQHNYDTDVTTGTIQILPLIITGTSQPIPRLSHDFPVFSGVPPPWTLDDPGLLVLALGGPALCQSQPWSGSRAFSAVSAQTRQQQRGLKWQKNETAAENICFKNFSNFWILLD